MTLMQILGPVEQPLTKEQIIKLYDKQIGEVIAACTDQHFDFERQILTNQARLNWQFIKGNHFSVPGNVTTPFGTIADYIPFDPTSGSEESGADVKLCPPINVIGGDCFKFMAVMGMSAPKVKGVADDPEDQDSLTAGQNADVNIRDLWKKTQMDRLWRTIAFHQYATGPCFIRGVWNTDRRKYGQTVEPKIGVGQAEDGSPMPIPEEGAEPTIYANGDAEVSVYSILEVSIPYDTKVLGFSHDLPFLKCEVLRSKWDLLEKYSGTEESSGPLEQ